MLPEKYRKFTVDLPLDHVQTGLAVGNGYLGLSVWGENGKINITPGCSSLWDHRGGEVWQENQTYANVCETLASKDEKRMAELFPSYSLNPSVIPVGRIVLDLPDAERVTLSIADSLISVDGKNTHVEIRLSQRDKNLFAIRGCTGFRLFPAYELTRALAERGFSAPGRRLQSADARRSGLRHRFRKTRERGFFPVFPWNSGRISCGFRRNRIGKRIILELFLAECSRDRYRR